MAEDREEHVGGTHPRKKRRACGRDPPVACSLWLVLVGGTHPGGRFVKKGSAVRVENYPYHLTDTLVKVLILSLASYGKSHFQHTRPRISPVAEVNSHITGLLTMSALQ